MAFELVVGAFTRGDEAALRPLLADGVFRNFSQALRARHDAGETSLSQLLGIESADIVDARLDGRMATIDVRFVSRQQILVKNSQGEIIEGTPDHPVPLIDVWSFSRDIKSSSPNWLLVATDSRDE
jgi:predicted lipid-binding transport protein (Tim44 family)